MRVRIDTKPPISELFERLTEIERGQVPFAAAKALTYAARGGRDDLKKYFSGNIDRPTPYTQRGAAFSPANKSGLEARVGVLPRQMEYLRYLFEGGSRGPRGAALVLPATQGGHKTSLDQYGNVRRGAYNRIKSALRDKEMKTLFSGVPKGMGAGSAGIWRRSRKKLWPVLLYEAQATYSTQLKMEDALDEQKLANEFAQNFRRFLIDAWVS